MSAAPATRQQFQRWLARNPPRVVPVGMSRPPCPAVGSLPATLLLVFGLIADALAAAPTPWSRVRTPTDGPARSIGGYSAGCVSGALPLPLRDPAWDFLRPGRHRNFGHPELLDFIGTLARRVIENKLGRLRVGDLGQPRGGPAPNGHASHQSGLDVDLAYALGPRRDGPALQPMVDRAHMVPTGAFGEPQVTLLRFAAEDPRVARIFVNPVLKRALCDAPGEDRAWRARIRPWWGHDEHFHVRLSCPPDSPECLNQPVVGPDEGCGAELAWWFADHSAEDRKKAAEAYGKRVGARPALPEACDALLPPRPAQGASKARARDRRSKTR